MKKRNIDFLATEAALLGTSPSDFNSDTVSEKSEENIKGKENLSEIFLPRLEILEFVPKIFLILKTFFYIEFVPNFFTHLGNIF